MKKKHVKYNRLKEMFSMNRKAYIKETRSVGGDVTILIFLILMALFFLLPVALTVINSFKPMEELFAFPPRFFVRRPSMDNYTQLFLSTNSGSVPVGRYIFNSVFFATFGTVGMILIVSMAAYPLAKNKFPGNKFIFTLITWSLLFVSTTGIPLYIIMSKMHIMDSIWAVLLPGFASSFGLFLLRQFMIVLPDETIDSARIDGAGEMKIWFSIVMPNCKPAWITLFIFAFKDMWNMKSGYLMSEELKTLPMLLEQISAGGIARAGVGYAATVLLILPPAIIFIISQSNIVKTMAYSGMK